VHGLFGFLTGGVGFSTGGFGGSTTTGQSTFTEIIRSGVASQLKLKSAEELPSISQVERFPWTNWSSKQSFAIAAVANVEQVTIITDAIMRFIRRTPYCIALNCRTHIQNLQKGRLSPIKNGQISNFEKY
jgi:hypothetical protein